MKYWIWNCNAFNGVFWDQWSIKVMDTVGANFELSPHGAPFHFPFNNLSYCRSYAVHFKWGKFWNLCEMIFCTLMCCLKNTIFCVKCLLLRYRINWIFDKFIKDYDILISKHNSGYEHFSNRWTFSSMSKSGHQGDSFHRVNDIFLPWSYIQCFYPGHDKAVPQWSWIPQGYHSHHASVRQQPSSLHFCDLQHGSKCKVPSAF